MNIVNMTPDSFVKAVLEAHEAKDFVLPGLFNLTTDKFVIVDQTFRERFLKATKIDLSFLSNLDLDISYYLGNCVEEVNLEKVELGDRFGESVVTSVTAESFRGDDLQRAFEALQWGLGFELLDLASVTLSSLDGKLIVEINNSPYFTGTFNVAC